MSTGMPGTRLVSSARAAARGHRGHPGSVLAAVSAAAFMAMLDNLAVTNALPAMGEDLGLGTNGLQWAVASYPLVLAATLLSGGRPVTGWGSGGPSSPGCSASWRVPPSAPWRPPSPARARALGLRGAIGGLGVALGPAFGGLLTQAPGWRSVMWINLPIGVVALAAAWRLLPCPPAAPARWDPVGQTLAVTGLGRNGAAVRTSHHHAGQPGPASQAGTAAAVTDTLREVGGVVGVAALGAVPAARMDSGLHDRAARAGLEHDATDELARAVVHGGPVPGPATGPGRDAGADYLTAWANVSWCSRTLASARPVRPPTARGRNVSGRTPPSPP
ncbi:MFS transporter [Streptomyces sp. NBC_01244]|uniref:MFS transporter n=1 Tax=Streptomyces sp. NBC_01244 TaxID=2903797 RepID=UPI002E145997|nr:MFS transporter [Streptomyces sp. NBC_01244]